MWWQWPSRTGSLEQRVGAARKRANQINGIANPVKKPNTGGGRVGAEVKEASRTAIDPRIRANIRVKTDVTLHRVIAQS